LLVGMSEEIVARERRSGFHGAASRKKMTEGWQGLGGSVPEILLTPDPIGSDAAAEPPVSTLTSAQATAPEDPSRLRHDYHQLLRRLALALVQEALAPSETSEVLERLLIIEEEQASLTGTIALSEQQFDRIRFEYSQREKRLRYAILDLGMEQADLRGRASADPCAAAELQEHIRDLTFQVGELDQRCRELDEERSARIQELAQDVKAFRDARLGLENEAAELFQGLHSQIESLRTVGSTRPALRAIYLELDELRRSLERARHG